MSDITYSTYEEFHEWNLNGKGSSEGGQPRRDGEWYRGSIYYYGDDPASRYIAGPKRKKVELIVRANVGHMSYEYREKMKAKLLRLNVMDIGVFSRYDDDWVPEAELHDRLRFLMLSRIMEFNDRYTPGLTGRQLVEEQQANSYRRTEKNLRSMLKGYYKEYNDYSKHFGLNWKEPPSLYLEKLEETFADLKRVWLDPFAVAKRERQKARREASKALGLD